MYLLSATMWYVIPLIILQHGFDWCAHLRKKLPSMHFICGTRFFFHRRSPTAPPCASCDMFDPTKPAVSQSGIQDRLREELAQLSSWADTKYKQLISSLRYDNAVVHKTPSAPSPSYDGQNSPCRTVVPELLAALGSALSTSFLHRVLSTL